MRIKIAKATSGAAFVNKKRAAEARIAAQESGIDMDDSFNDEDLFELQHHHLLRCLEKTTVSGILIYEEWCVVVVESEERGKGKEINLLQKFSFPSFYFYNFFVCFRVII